MQLIAPPQGNSCFVYISSSTDVKLSNAIISPNPASNYIHFDNLETSSYTYNIYNALGQLVLRGLLTDSKQIDINCLESGLYFLELTSDQLSKSTKRFIKE